MDGQPNNPGPNPPSWVRDAIFYQIFPDRFARSERLKKPGNLEPWDAPPSIHGYKGGDLLGVEERLDWLTDLGVTALYFNPVFQSASNHRYHTHDYFQVDPLLGGDPAFDELVTACKERGLRMVLDGVFNHASRGFFQFNDVLENGSHSPWIDWFHIHGWPLRAYDPAHPANYSAWWGLHALPKLNTENPDVREFIMGVAEHWLHKGIDGWRLDVPQEITTPGFWEEFRRRAKSVNPDAYLVGEIWQDARSWIARGDRFDGTMNYLLTGATIAFAAGRRVVDHVVDGITYEVRPAKDAGAYADAIDHLLRLYPDATQQANLNLLGSHDTPRLLTVAGGDRDSVVLAALLMFTFPGAPCIYYGDEVGMQGERDPACRGAFPWQDPGRWDGRILSAYRTLIALRTAHPSLRHGEYRRVWPEPGAAGMLYAFTRRTGEDAVLVAVNAGDDQAAVKLPGGVQVDDGLQVWGEGTLRPLDGSTELSVPPRSGAVWQIGPG